MISIRKFLLLTALFYLLLLAVSLFFVLQNAADIQLATNTQQKISQVNENVVSLLLLNNETAHMSSQRIVDQWQATTGNILKLTSDIKAVNHADTDIIERTEKLVNKVRGTMPELISLPVKSKLHENLSFKLAIDLQRISTFASQLDHLAQEQITLASQRNIQLILSLIVLLVIVTLVITLFARHYINKPLNTVLSKLAQIRQGDRQTQLPATKTEEFQLISQQINSTISQLNEITVSKDALQIEVNDRIKAEQKAIEALEELHQAQEHMLHIEKLSAMGTFVGGLAHEMNNPLMGIGNYLEFIDKHMEEGKPREMLHRAQEETSRIMRLVRNMLIYARAKPDNASQCEIAGTFDRIISILEARLTKESVSLQVNMADNLPMARISCDSLQQVIMNLVSNSIDAVSDQSHKQLQVTTSADDSSICLVIEDNGPGIPEELRAKVTDPFFTTKPPGKGTGLGLSICLQLINEVGGSMNISSSDTLGGVRFEILLLSAVNGKLPEKIS